MGLIYEGDHFTGVRFAFLINLRGEESVLASAVRLSRRVSNPQNFHGDVVWPGCALEYSADEVRGRRVYACDLVTVPVKHRAANILRHDNGVIGNAVSKQRVCRR